jgi:type IV pilus assembly protein PilM
MQVEAAGHGHRVTGYGVAGIDPKTMVDGVIIDPEGIAKVAHELFSKNIIGEITSRRASMALPASRTFNRTLTLPKMQAKDIPEAVKLEAEQYIPVPIDDLYIDYGIISETDKQIEILAVAVPKKIVDSYLTLTRLLGLEAILLETSIEAASRLFVHAEQSDVPTILIDLGSLSSDITIYDDTLIVTGTVPGGGDSFTDLIADKLKVSRQEAHVIKTKYGMGVSKKQKEIIEGLGPILEQMIKEIRRMVRYYEERANTDKKIDQIVTMGGGANMPGLSEHLTNTLRLPVRMVDPWQHLDFAGLQPPNTIEKSMYVTVSGLALANSKEIFS